MTTLGALIILYHPTDAQLAQIGSLRHAADAFAMVDNSPEPDARAHALAEREGMLLLHHGNRNGIAGAFNVGLEALFAQGVDAVALFDQDSTVPDGFFPKMRATADQLGSRAYLVGPRIFDENEKRFLPELATSGALVRRLRLDEQSELQRCAFLISSGSVISRAAFDTLGRFDESLFIDHVDTEYCFRALERNVPLYVAPSLVLPHRIGSRQRHHIGPFEMTAMHHPWYRRYYSARNAMQLGIQYGLRFPVAVVPNLLTLWQVVQVVLCERDKGAKLQAIGCGVYDGMLGRLGPLDTVRPGWSARMLTEARRG